MKKSIIRCLIHYLKKWFEDRSILRTVCRNISRPRMLVKRTMHPHTIYRPCLYELMSSLVLIYQVILHRSLNRSLQTKMRAPRGETHCPAHMALCPFLDLFVTGWIKRWQYQPLPSMFSTWNSQQILFWLMQLVSFGYYSVHIRLFCHRRDRI